jgi:putative oxidoreductase
MFQISDNSVMARYAEKSRSSKALNVTFWILQGLLAAAFLVAGTTKLAGPQMQVAFFEKIGLGQWFRYFTGGLEVIGAILVLVPRTAVVGAALLGVTMVGAVDIHLLITGGSPVPSVVLLVIAVAVIWYRELYLKTRQYQSVQNR